MTISPRRELEKNVRVFFVFLPWDFIAVIDDEIVFHRVHYKQLYMETLLVALMIFINVKAPNFTSQSTTQFDKFFRRFLLNFR